MCDEEADIGRAQEVAENWVNGNLSDVRKALSAPAPIAAAALAVDVYLAIRAYDRTVASDFARRLAVWATP